MKTNKKRIHQESSQCAAPAQIVPFKLPEVHSESFTKYKSELDIERLKQPLTRENYVEKFHHLLCWEEKEHDTLLRQRYLSIFYACICPRVYNKERGRVSYSTIVQCNSC